MTSLSNYQLQNNTINAKHQLPKKVDRSINVFFIKLKKNNFHLIKARDLNYRKDL